ncbi:MAG: N-carbamoylputrescine amidase [Actinomycetota bacterium]
MTLSLAAIQMSMSETREDNVATAERLVRQAASGGAEIILIPELFEGQYFCKEQEAVHHQRATSIEDNVTISHFQKVAAELKVVLPLSVYERAGNALFNTVVMVDADGSRIGVYRKSHIPDGPGYSEKFYFSPGDTGFRVWNTQRGRIGVGICWDQWFPEAARAMALQGAECILYPTAIGSEPQDPTWDSSRHWQRVMQGHAAANLIPVMAANRVGREVQNSTEITFYGSSFITDNTGALVAEAGRDSEEIIHATFDRSALSALRSSWGLFRDRRPELYGSLLTLDGSNSYFSQPQQ